MRTRRFGDGAFSFGIWPPAPVVRNLLIANFAVWFVLLVFDRLHNPWFLQTFQLDPRSALPWRPWQIATYMFLHSLGPGHVIGNMLMLFLVGSSVEHALGSRRLLRLYLICGVAGGLLSLMPPFSSAGVPIVGASGAVLGVITAWGLLFPHATVYLFFVLPIPAIALVIGLALFNLMMAASSSGGTIAHMAHLGGMAAAYVMMRGVPYSGRWSRRWAERARQRDARRRADLRRRTDDILDKMHREGRESLTQAEWRTLLEESKRMRDK